VGRVISEGKTLKTEGINIKVAGPEALDGKGEPGVVAARGRKSQQSGGQKKRKNSSVAKPTVALTER